MNKVNCHSVPKVIIGSLFSNKVMNIHGIPLTDSVHTVLCLDKRLKIRQINTNLYDCGVSWLVQHLLKLDPVSANQNKEQRTSDTVVCRTHDWISSPLASLCSVPTAFCDYDFSLGFFLIFHTFKCSLWYYLGNINCSHPRIPEEFSKHNRAGLSKSQTW